MSGQPWPSGQQGQPPGPPVQQPRPQPPPPHAITSSGATGERGSFTRAELARLNETRGFQQDLTKFVNFQVIPVWSDERWNGTYQGITDGFTFKARQIGLGDSVVANRPAIRSEDDQRNPSEYARRFGIGPRQVGRDNWAHSGLTPVDPAFQTSAQAPEYDALDESLQTVFFDYTSAELVAQGAFNPRLPISWPPDIDETVHELFSRYRWDQRTLIPSYWDGAWNVRYGPILNGTSGVYDAIHNQAVWDAIEPALKLVSRIIRSDHPYWLAMTSMFHLRPVPAAQDGRTPQQRAEQGGTPYTSVWLDDKDSDPRIPAPYPEMAKLKSLGFDSAASRDVCIEVLLANLKFKIFSTNVALAMTTQFHDWNLAICLNASMIWPLLMNRHVSNAEKATFTFDIASCMLHEIAHACANVHRDLTSRAHLIYSTSFGPKVTAEMWASLVRLGDQIYGPIRKYQGQNWVDRPLPRQQLLIEDEAQGEEGLNFEKQLWGNRVTPHHSIGAGEFSMGPLLILVPFPGQHPQPLQQGRTLTDQKDRAYNRYLTDPRAPSWNENLAIPVEWYNRYFQNDWWSSEFQKFKHHGLKLTTNDPNLPTSLLRTNGPSAAVTGNRDDLAFIFGEQAWNWLHSTVLAILATRDHGIISLYIQSLIGQAAQAQLFATRFQNEMLSWPVKYQGLCRAAKGVHGDYQIMLADFQLYLLPGAAIYNFDTAAHGIRQMNTSIRRVLGPMLELSRLMTQDVGYQQYILTQYLQLDAGVRASFQGNMQQLSAMTQLSLNLLGGLAPNISLAFSTLTLETEGDWVDLLQEKIFNDLWGADEQLALSTSLPPDIAAETQTFVDLLGEIKSLHRSFHAHHNLQSEMHTLITSATASGRVPDSAEWPRLPSFARARHQRMTTVLEPAAMREMSNIESHALVTMLSEALALLSTKLDPALLDPAQMALKTALEQRAARQAVLVQEWRLFLRNQKLAMLQHQQARQAALAGVPDDPTPAALLVEMRKMAKGVKDDERFLDTMYSAETVKETLDLIILDLAN